MTTRSYSLPANLNSMSLTELHNLRQDVPAWALTAWGKPTTVATRLDEAIRAAYERETSAKTKTTPASAPATAGPEWGDISGLFREALGSLTDDTEKMYQAGKRRTLSDIAMQSVQSGMANTLNMPAAGIAYDEANRSATNLALGQAKAGILTNLGQTAANIYGQNLGAQTQRYGIDVGAQTQKYSTDVGSQTQRYTADVGAQTQQTGYALSAASDAAQRALQKYIADLQYGGQQGGGSYTGSLQRVA